MGLQQVFIGNLRKYRKRAAFTQEKLAELCDCDPSYIRQIEIGRRFPSVRYIERLAQALGVEPHLLFFDENAHSADAGMSDENARSPEAFALAASPRLQLESLLTEKINACITQTLAGWYAVR
jgi:transcriptional regulator with XRE-family HTH domain